MPQRTQREQREWGREAVEGSGRGRKDLRYEDFIVWQKAMELSTPKTMTMSTQERIAVVG